jgi:hypothetical protein
MEEARPGPRFKADAGPGPNFQGGAGPAIFFLPGAAADDIERPDARVAELVDAHDSKSCSARSVGSIPSTGTKTNY